MCPITRHHQDGAWPTAANSATRPPSSRLRAPPLSIAGELAFLGHALEGFIRAFDSGLIILPVGRKQLHDPIGIVARHMPDRPRREVHGLSDLELVRFQHWTRELNHPAHLLA